MEISESMKKSGWKLVKGTWVAPVEESKLERINIVETGRGPGRVSRTHRESFTNAELIRKRNADADTLLPGWVKVPPHQAGLVNAFKRFGLSDAEAVHAAG